MQKILSKMRKAIEDYNMLNKGDKIAVGISGGKDSLALLLCMSQLIKHIYKEVSIVAITIDCSNGKTDFTALSKWCKDVCGTELIIEKTNIFEIIFDERKEKNPCSLCSKMRRGVLNTVAIKHGCNKIALGHHADDLMETLFLSLFYEGRLSTFQPTGYMDRTKIHLIRPLLYIEEDQIKKLSKGFPILKNPCPANGYTKREYMKNLIHNLQKDIPQVKERILGAITNPERYNLFPIDKNSKKQLK